MNHLYWKYPSFVPQQRFVFIQNYEHASKAEFLWMRKNKVTIFLTVGPVAQSV